MNIIFDNLRKNKNKLSQSVARRSNMNSRQSSPSPSVTKPGSVSFRGNHFKFYDSLDHDTKMFLQIVSQRLTKKLFLAKQKLRFLKEMIMSHRGKVIYEGDSVDNIISLDRKIELYQEVLRHIRENSVHRMNLKPFNIIFIDDQETKDIANKLSEYQKKFLHHMMKRK